MINILIAEKNMNYCKQILKEISLKTTNTRIFSIVSTIEDLEKTISTNIIDIVIINVSLFPNINLDMLSTKSITKIYFLKISDFKINYSKNKSDIIYQKNNITEIINKINELSFYKNKSIDETIIKNKIKQELLFLGYNFTHIGTKYLIDAILYLYIIGDYANENLDKHVYPIISKKYKKTSHNIKCNIINATDSMFYDCEENKLKTYLGVTELYKPGPKKIVCAVLNKLLLKL